MLKRNFTTIFPRLLNVNLVKDMGMIPFYLFKNHGYCSHIVSYKNEEKYHYLENEVKGLTLHFLKEHFLHVLRYLIKNSKKINVLNLYRFEYGSFVYALAYKLFNPKGFLYLKLDLDENDTKINMRFFNSKSVLKSILLKYLEIIMFQIVDLFSVETKIGLENIIKTYPQLKNKGIYIPNGIDSDFIDTNIYPISYEKKENIIITVGRIGAEQKNSQMLIDILPELNLKDWQVYFIGQVEPYFENILEKLYYENPWLKKNVVFTGSINNKNELYDWYSRAKIFCHTAMWEGFPLVFPEALYFGNYIVTTSVSGAREITDKERIGKIIPVNNRDKLAEELQYLIDNEQILKNNFKPAIEHAKKYFVWDEIVENLYNEIELRLK